MTRHLVATAVVSLLGLSALEAQPARRGPNADSSARPGGGRPQLESQVHRSFTRAVKLRLGLSDEQLGQLARSTARFEGRRRSLMLEERENRVALRRELAPGAAPDQRRIEVSLERLMQIHRQRVELQTEEQRELATFLTPLQRARYMALQEQMRRRVEGLRRGRAAGRRAPGGGGG